MITVGFILMDRLLMSFKLNIIGSWENCNIIASRKKYFYLNVIGMTPLIDKSK